MQSWSHLWSYKNQEFANVDDATKNVVELLQFLLPGFVAAWIFYGFSSHPKPGQFERVVEALIFTMFIQAAVAIERRLFFWLGARWHSFGVWDHDAEIVWLVISGIALGLMAAWLSHTDRCHRIARDLGITSRASFPCEWFHAFVGVQRYLVLQLKDERRLFGYPRVWPSDPAHGHFLMVRASWLPTAETPDYQQTREIDLVVVNVEDVRWVEFMQEEEAADEHPTKQAYTDAAFDARLGGQGRKRESAATLRTEASAYATATATQQKMR